MDAVIRRKLEMAARVRTFSRAHPFTDASYSVILARFEERLAKAEVIIAQQRTGQIAVHAATARRIELRRNLQQQMLRRLVAVGELAARAEPVLVGRFRLPPDGGTNHAYLAAARAMLTAGQVHQAILVRHGMAESLLDELEMTLLQLEATTATIHGGRANHVGSRGDLRLVATELGMLVGLLDGLNRHRFRNEPMLLADWNAARTIRVPVRSNGPTPPIDGRHDDSPNRPGRAAA